MKKQLSSVCPECSKDSLVYSQNADIYIYIEDGKLVPHLDIDNITWFDDTSLNCTHCGESDSTSLNIAERKRFLDHFKSKDNTT